MLQWLLFGFGVFGAYAGVNALLPFRRGVVLLAPGFLTGWIVTELGIFVVMGELLAVALIVGWVGIDSHLMWVTLTLLSVGVLGMGYNLWLATSTGRLLRETLDAAIGVADVDDAPSGPSFWRAFVPFWMQHPDVLRTRDLNYGADGARRHRMDIYQRRDDEGAVHEGDVHEGEVEGRPVILQIHGGGWIVGSKDHQGLPLLHELARQGFVCVAINYGLSPRATWPDHLIDCKRALAWVKENIISYGGDPKRVIVTGGSAGGHLTALLALTANVAEYQPGFEQVDTSVAGAIPFYGVYDWTNRLGTRKPRSALRLLLERGVVKNSSAGAIELFDRASPMSCISEEAPPFFVIHGDRDNLVPVHEARHFSEMLQGCGDSPVAYGEIRGAHHAFDVFYSIRTIHVIRAVSRFATWLSKRDLSPPAQATAARGSAGTPAAAGKRDAEAE